MFYSAAFKRILYEVQDNVVNFDMPNFTHHKDDIAKLNTIMAKANKKLECKVGDTDKPDKKLGFSWQAKYSAVSWHEKDH